MPTRRELLVGGFVAGAAGLLRGAETLRAEGPQPATKINFSVPAGSCDCHVHVFGERDRYPFSTGRAYTPETATVEPLARALVAANPQRVLWGSSWPHPGSAAGRGNTDLSPNRQIDDGLVLNLVPVRVPDVATRQMILVDNPARLYGF